MMRSRAFAMACAVLTLSAPAFAQGKSQAHKNGSPPSRNALPAPAVASPVGGVTPFAWVDDASLIEPGTVWLAMSVVRWQGSDASEVDVPVVDAAVGLTPRVQLAATVSRAMAGTDPSGAPGGVGTSYFSAKIAALNSATPLMKLSVAPTLEVLGSGVLQAPDECRAHFGIPVSVEVDRGAARVYASAGYFSRGVWFTGLGVGAQASDRVFVSIGYSRSWRTTDALDVPIADRARNEVTGSVSYALTSNVGVFGSIATTLATLDENGAGTTVGAGMSFSFRPAVQPESGRKRRN